MKTASDPCPRPTCRHPRDWHEHLRSGNDCGRCLDCHDWPGPVERLLIHLARLRSR